MDGFERRKEQSKQEIRQAARELFSQFGVDKVSVVDIARKAGVSPATIYNRFGSKGALVREFVETAIDELVGEAQEVLFSERRFPAKMAALIHFISERMAAQDRPAAARTVFAASLDLRNAPEIAEIRSAAQERMADLLLDAVREGTAEGWVNPELSEQALRIYFRALMELFADTRLQHQFAADPGLVQDLGSLMLSGLCGPRRTNGVDVTEP